MCETDWSALTASATDRMDFHLAGTGAVADLEEKLRRFYGMRYALCTASATSALLGVALALDLRGAEFLTTPYTYGASLAAWLLLGNRPRFVDIDSHDLSLQPESARERITRETKAILAVDIFGIPGDTRALRRLADEFGLWYVADAAQSLGSRRDGLPGSALADALVVSFTAGKTVSAGEGGAVLTNHADLYEKLLWHTQHPERQRRELSLALWNEFGINARIHPLGAAQANAAFEPSLGLQKQHQRWCLHVLDLMNESGQIQPVRFRESQIVPSFFRLTAAWKNAPRAEQLLGFLKSRGVTATIQPKPVRLVYRQPAFLAQYGSFEAPECPNAERQERMRFCVVSCSQ
jgi:dTDP-4-amino-4,6-dideoxygalactose transaminase